MVFFSGATTSAQCLLNTPTNLPVETSYVGLTYPGQIWTANDQCQQLYGKNASFCPVCLTSYFSIEKSSDQLLY